MRSQSHIKDKFHWIAVDKRGFMMVC